MAWRAQTKADLRWFEKLPCAMEVCDEKYNILYMNERAAEVNREAGGESLVGKNLMDCHKPESQKKLREMIASGKPNIYTVEKKGVKKLVSQSPWRRNGKVAGLLEITFELPKDLPNHK